MSKNKGNDITKEKRKGNDIGDGGGGRRLFFSRYVSRENKETKVHGKDTLN